MSKTGKKSKRYNSSLQAHKRYKKTLTAPLMSVNPTFTSWNPDTVPEMLLIDAILSSFDWNKAALMFGQICDLLDGYVPETSKDVILGAISSLNLIPENNREAATSTLVEVGLYDVIIPDGLKHGLALYPDFPCLWLIDKWKQEHHVDWEIGTSYLKGAIIRLWDSKNVHTSRCRFLTLSRMVKHGKLKVTQEAFDKGAFELFPRYPDGLTKDAQKLVEASARALFTGLLTLNANNANATSWVKHFWRHNYEISVCEESKVNSSVSVIEDETLFTVLQNINKASLIFIDLFNEFAQQIKFDIYQPDRDEVILGLISRQFRLYSQLVMNSDLWVQDMCVMFHRAMVDTLINMKWMIQQNDSSIFSKFKEYSIGNVKLTKLKIEDMIDEGSTNLQPIADELSSLVNEEIWEEFVNIDLGGNFTGKNIRTMAEEAGLKKQYDLIYSPASSELHGEWVSLKRHNMRHCVNPLHRFHRLPSLSQSNLISPGAVLLAAQILQDTFKLCLATYKLEHLKPKLQNFTDALNAVFEDW